MTSGMWMHPRLWRAPSLVVAPCVSVWMCAVAMLPLWPAGAMALGRIDLLDFAAPGGTVDRSGHADASGALAAAIRAANAITARGDPACVYVPAGVYRIVTPPPAFARAGCITGEGPTQSIFKLDPAFAGDLFAWSEAWAPTTPGPTVVGLAIRGDPAATPLQNALVFYDRNDRVFIDNVEVDGLHGRALYSGVRKHMPEAYMRESRMRSLRFFNDGAPGVPVVEFCSEGSGHIPATNEIELSQVDIYGARGPGLVIRNNGQGSLRDFIVDGLRIEGPESGAASGDLLAIGDGAMAGRVSSIRLQGIELIDAPAGFAALHINAPGGAPGPYQITVDGSIGGGVPRGEGLRIDAGRNAVLRLSSLHSSGTNVVIGRGVSGVVLDGGGQEHTWHTDIDPSSAAGVSAPSLAPLNKLESGQPAP